MDPKTNKQSIRYAPAYAVSGQTACPYTEEALAKFLGMMTPDRQVQEKFRAALGALELIEQGYLKENQLDDERMGTKYLWLRRVPGRRACRVER